MKMVLGKYSTNESTPPTPRTKALRPRLPSANGASTNSPTQTSRSVATVSTSSVTTRLNEYSSSRNGVSRTASGATSFSRGGSRTTGSSATPKMTNVGHEVNVRQKHAASGGRQDRNYLHPRDNQNRNSTGLSSLQRQRQRHDISTEQQQHATKQGDLFHVQTDHNLATKTHARQHQQQSVAAAEDEGITALLTSSDDETTLPSEPTYSSETMLTTISSLTFHSYNSLRGKQQKVDKTKALADSIEEDTLPPSFQQQATWASMPQSPNGFSGVVCNDDGKIEILRKAFEGCLSNPYADNRHENNALRESSNEGMNLQREDLSSEFIMSKPDMRLTDELTAYTVAPDSLPREAVMNDTENRNSRNDHRTALILWPRVKVQNTGVNTGDLVKERLTGEIGLHLTQVDQSAVVRKVRSHSDAAFAGIRKDDIVLFAVALTKVDREKEQECKLAKKVALRLESLGMRTSYTELFDMFLAETTATWPVAIVFSHQPKSRHVFDDFSLSVLKCFSLEDHCNRAAQFLRDLNLRNRELTAGGMHEVIQGEIETYMPRPEGILYDDRGGARKSLDPCSSVLHVEQTLSSLTRDSESGLNSLCSETIREMHLLCSRVEDALAIAFIRCAKTGVGFSVSAGSGIVIARLDDGSWSAPSAIGYMGVGVGMQVGFEVNEYIFLVHSMELLDKFRKGGQFIFGSNVGATGFGYGREYCGIAPIGENDASASDQENSMFSAYAKNSGMFVGVSVEGATITSVDSVNNSVYKGEGAIDSSTSAREILSGSCNPPRETKDLYFALRSIEYRYSLFAHPVPPSYMKKYARSLWTIDFSSPPPSRTSPSSPSILGSTELSFSLRELLLGLTHSDHVSVIRKRELEIFGKKFKRFLLEGVPVTYLGDGTNREERRMYLIQSPGNSLVDAKIRFFSKILKEGKKMRRSCDLFLLNEASRNDCMTLGRIIRLSQEIPPTAIQNPIKKMSDLSRLIYMQNDSGGKLMFLAKTQKDAELLMCGLKLLLERNEI